MSAAATGLVPLLNFVFLGKLAAAISLIPCIGLLVTVLCMVEFNPSVFGNIDADPITKVHHSCTD